MIAYGVHGYGKGHAMRASAVLPELVRRHGVLVWCRRPMGWPLRLVNRFEDRVLETFLALEKWRFGHRNAPKAAHAA